MEGLLKIRGAIIQLYGMCTEQLQEALVTMWPVCLALPVYNLPSLIRKAGENAGLGVRQGCRSREV